MTLIGSLLSAVIIDPVALSSTQVYVIFTVLKCNPFPPFYTVVTTLHVAGIHRHYQVQLTLTTALQLFLKSIDIAETFSVVMTV
jgi:hypothetical protein